MQPSVADNSFNTGKKKYSQVHSQVACVSYWLSIEFFLSISTNEVIIVGIFVK